MCDGAEYAEAHRDLQAWYGSGNRWRSIDSTQPEVRRDASRVGPQVDGIEFDLP